MPFTANYSVNQDFQTGVTITVTDTSNYSFNANSTKANCTDRYLILTNIDTLTAPVTLPFPFTNVNDNVQDIITFDIDRDRAMVIELVIVNPLADPDSILFNEAAVCFTQFIENCKLAKLDGLNLQLPKDRKIALDLFVTIIGEQSAIIEASRGDLLEAQKNLDFTINYCQCGCNC